MSKSGFACTILSDQLLFSGGRLHEDTPLVKQAKALAGRLHGTGAVVDVYGASDLVWSVEIVRPHRPRTAVTRPAK